MKKEIKTNDRSFRKLLHCMIHEVIKELADNHLLPQVMAGFSTGSLNG